MEPCAEWRRTPGDPRSVAVWALRSVYEMVPSVLWNTLLVLLIIGAIALVCACFSAIGCFPSFDGLGDGERRPPRPWRAPKTLGWLVASPSPSPVYPVVLRVYTDGVLTGRDEGMVLFVDGWLIYEGQRTAFSLRGCDEVPIGAHEGRGRLPDGREFELAPYDQMDDRRDLHAIFEGAMRRWRRELPPPGRSVLPPRAVQPRAFGHATASVILGILLLASSSIALWVGGLVAWIVGGLVALCGLWRVALGLRDLYKLLGLTGPSPKMCDEASRGAY